MIWCCNIIFCTVHIMTAVVVSVIAIVLGFIIHLDWFFSNYNYLGLLIILLCCYHIFSMMLLFQSQYNITRFKGFCHKVFVYICMRYVYVFGLIYVLACPINKLHLTQFAIFSLLLTTFFPCCYWNFPSCYQIQKNKDSLLKMTYILNFKQYKCMLTDFSSFDNQCVKIIIQV